MKPFPFADESVSRSGVDRWANWIDDFVDILVTRGYATSVIRRHVRAAAIFSTWLERQRIAATEIDEPLVARFISGLPRWRASKRRHDRVSSVAGGVRLLAEHLWTRGVGARPGPVAARCEAQQWLQRFDDHLVQVHGLVVGTRRMYRRYAAALLAECAGMPTPDWSRLTVSTISAFVQTRASQLGPSARRHPVTATRAFLRFLATRGVVPARIEGAVPPIREWKHAGLPRAIADDDVQRVLAAVDETHPTGHRDRAILLLLSRLGLRAAEAAALTVKDIDWHNGTVRVAGKGGRERQLPLPADVGESLVATLRSRPPTSPTDVILVTALAPYRQLSAASVTGIAERALRSAGVTVPRPGAHVFRGIGHSACRAGSCGVPAYPRGQRDRGASLADGERTGTRQSPLLGQSPRRLVLRWLPTANADPAPGSGPSGPRK